MKTVYLMNVKHFFRKNGPKSLQDKDIRRTFASRILIQHSTAQHSTAQHSTAQHSTAQPAVNTPS
jgi:hypothetical protein